MAAQPDHHIVPTRAADSLALAMVASSSVPLLLLDETVSVIAASSTFCGAFGLDRSTVRGRPLSELGAGEWNVPQVGSLLRATVAGSAAIEAYEMDLNREGQEPRRLVLNAHKLDYGDPNLPRLLLTVTDVSDARSDAKAKDDLLREKAILLQELQHRVANSLQIVASILMQSARRVQSDTTRDHLHDAHHRVMSIAAIQRQLASSTLGQVLLRSYLTDLCASIGTSMIHDSNQLTLEVSADESTTSSDASVSIGLIVTELVINALKHAFPGRRPGKIKVDYRSTGGKWTLTVSDNGVGMPVGNTTPGLGTSIVQALANQLGASISFASADPGAVISVVHEGVVADTAAA